MRLEIPYGTGLVTVELDEANVAGVVRAAEMKSGDEHEILTQALSSPVGSAPLGDFLEGSRDAVVIVNDAKRATPTARLLELIRPELASVAELTFVIATGTHRPPTSEERARILGDAAQRPGARVVVNDARSPDGMTYLGRTARGTEVHLNRLVTDASRIVVIGSVEPHYFAGFTGGRKAFLPGVAAFETVRQNHSHALDPSSCFMALDGNPVHEDMLDALALLGDKPIFTIMTVIDDEHRVRAASAGDIHGAFLDAVVSARKMFSVDVPGRCDIVVAVARSPIDSDLYQAHKAIEGARLALKAGGILILVAECGEGLGNDAFVGQLASAASPEDVARRIGERYNLGDHKAIKLAELVTESEIWAVTGLSRETVESIFFHPCEGLQDALNAALAKRGPGARVLFLMDAGTTVPRLP
ncbi:MAG: nickel-dependent lactate racemase [Candidatus Eisenbacteria bacterium]|nr:nickel-dependent lactate racemase [Candidatus Eisenbacteria bacterium]